MTGLSMTTPPPPPQSAGGLADALASPEPEVRRRAVAGLALVQAAAAVPLLLRALADPDFRVRKEATFVATAFHRERALRDALVARLGEEDDVGLRNAAASVLTAMGSLATAAVTAAMGALDAPGRTLAAEVLGRSGDGGALAALSVARHDDDANVRHAAVEGIARLAPTSPESAGELLLRCLDDDDPLLRLAALSGLRDLGPPLPWLALEPLIADPMLAAVALEAAALAESPEAPVALARALVSGAPSASRAALGSLARLVEAGARAASRVGEALERAPREHLERLVAIARGEGEEPPDQRRAALVVAAEARAPGAVQAALDALDEPTLEAAARGALVRLDLAALPALVDRLRAAPPSQGPRAVPHPGNPDPTLAMLDAVAAIAEASGRRTGPPPAPVPDAIDAVCEAARRDEPSIAAGALFALSRIGSIEDLPLAARLARSGDAPVARAAEGAVAAITRRSEADAAVFAREAARADPLAAALVIGALGPRAEPVLDAEGGDFAFLEREVRSGDPAARRAAALAIAEVGGPDAPDVLGRALSDERRDVQLAAARALGRLHAGPASRRVPPEAAGPRSTLERPSRAGDPDLVAAAVDALSPPVPEGEPPASSRDELVAALASIVAVADASIALAAVNALARVPEDAAGRAPALALALGHGDADVVVTALRKLGRSTPAPALAACLAHPSADVRRAADELAGGATRARSP
jgi:HEAT repeat protein